MTGVISISSFVGRREQLGLIDEAAAAARAAEPRFVVIGGEAGVGKTRLMEHSAVRLAESGVRVLRGTCVELGTEGLPLAPVTSVLRELIHQIGVDGLSALLPGADVLLRLLPELGAAEVNPKGQGRLFDQFAALLDRLSIERPVLLVVDDLHWADKSTRELFGFLARVMRTARVLVMMAYRTDALARLHPLPAFLAELARLPGVHRLELGRLGRAETEELITGVLGEGPPASLVERVYRLSDGNAFFAEELARAHAARSSEGPARLPESLRELLLDRIGSLSGTTRRVIGIAAVGGPSIPHGLLSVTAELDEAALLDALRPAVDARVLTPEPQGDAYRFRHELLREAVVEDLLPVERARLHRAYAEALERRPDLVPRERFAAEVAYHWYGSGDANRALPALLRAAGAAEAMRAHSEQSQMLLRAVDIWPRVTDPALLAGLDRLGIWVGLITGAVWAGEDLHALDLIDRALAETDQAAEPERAAMLLALRGMALHNLGRDGAVIAVEEALALLPAAPTVGRARVLDLLGAVLMMRGSTEQARELAEEAARIAADAGEVDVAANARTTVAVTLAQLGSYDEALAVLDEVRATTERRADPMRLTRVHLNRAAVLGSIGRHAEAIDAARTGLEVVRGAGLSRVFGANLSAHLAAALAAVGRWQEAEAVCAEALAMDPPGRFGASMHVTRGEIALARGELELAREQQSLAATLLGHAVGRGPEPVQVLRLAAEVALRDGRIGDADRAVADGLRVSGECGAPANAWRLLVTGARVEAASRMRARTMGAEPAGRSLVGPLRATAAVLGADTPLASACAAQLAAELGVSGASWSAVIAAWDAVGEPYPAAYARLRAAEESPAAAADRLREAADVASRIGATALLAEIHLRTGSTEAAHPADPPATGKLGLTDRETEVLRLVVAGRSNREIAKRLFISPKTASVHVSRILRKLGVASRVEAAALAVRLHLFGPTT